MIHFIWIYLKTVTQLGVEPGDVSVPIDVILPTGAMGNITGGYMAKKMGVPLGLLCAGVNINDITHRVIETGKFHRSHTMERTLSEAINIQVPYNFERILFYLTNGNYSLISEWMTCMESNNKLDLDAIWLRKLQDDFRSARVTDAEMCEAMKSVIVNDDYFIDPHTAVAIAAAKKLGYFVKASGGQPYSFVILATASPCKLQESVSAAIGKSGWEDYCDSSFPCRAENVLQKEEIPPTFYPRANGTLADTQTDWETRAITIIDSMLR